MFSPQLIHVSSVGWFLNWFFPKLIIDICAGARALEFNGVWLKNVRIRFWLKMKQLSNRYNLQRNNTPIEYDVVLHLLRDSISKKIRTNSCRRACECVVYRTLLVEFWSCWFGDLTIYCFTLVRPKAQSPNAINEMSLRMLGSLQSKMNKKSYCTTTTSTWIVCVWCCNECFVVCSRSVYILWKLIART